MKPTEEQVAAVIELVYRGYNPSACGWTEQRSQGNDTDVFEDGTVSGYSSALYEVGKLLGMKLAEPLEPEYDF